MTFGKRNAPGGAPPAQPPASRGTPSGTPTGSDRFLALLPLAEARFPSASQIATATNALMPELAAAPAVAKTPANSPSVLLQVGKSIIVLMFIDRPLPPDALFTAFATERLWPTAKSEVAPHKAHVVASVMNMPETFAERREAAVHLTAVLGALCRTAPVIGVNWSDAETITKAALLPDWVLQVRQGKWPIHLWAQFIWFGGQTDAQGRRMLGILTRGLRTFVGREIEFEPVALPPETVYDRVCGVVSYLLTQGMVLKDGDSVGISAREKIRVRHGVIEGQNIPVLRLRLETAEAA
jgi:hypothetical protein